jgi:REP element-mobilizing transposase RayT
MERPGAWYHVTARGNERRSIYRDDSDRRHFCQLLAQAVEVFGWLLHTYVLMDNHFHLLVETPEANLGRGMQWLNVSYSVWFNRRHQRSGHLFQGRYKAIIVDPMGWGLELSRYVHLNPVRLGRLGLDKRAQRRDRVGVGGQPDLAMVKARTAELRRYPWSSYRAYLGLTKTPVWLRRDRILELGGGRKGQRAREAYREYVESAIRQGLAESPWEKLTAQTVLGGAELVRQVGESLRGEAREHSRWRELRGRPKFAEIIAVVEKAKAERWESFRDRYGDWGRDLALYLGKEGFGLKLRELGAAAGGMDYMSVSVAVKRLERRAEKDAALSTALHHCRKELKMSNVDSAEKPPVFKKF